MKKYSLSEIETMTGYTSRSLRKFMAEGLLKGELVGRKWTFTEEQLNKFLTNGNVREGLKIKNGIIAKQFLEDFAENRACVIYNVRPSEELVAGITDKIRGMKTDIQFSYFCDEKTGIGRFILAGDVNAIGEITSLFKEM